MLSHFGEIAGSELALGSGRGHLATGFSPKPVLPAPAACGTFPRLPLRLLFAAEVASGLVSLAALAGSHWLPPLPSVSVPSALAVGLPPSACEV